MTEWTSPLILLFRVSGIQPASLPLSCPNATLLSSVVPNIQTGVSKKYHDSNKLLARRSQKPNKNNPIGRQRFTRRKKSKRPLHPPDNLPISFISPSAGRLVVSTSSVIVLHASIVSASAVTTAVVSVSSAAFVVATAAAIVAHSVVAGVTCGV